MSVMKHIQREDELVSAAISLRKLPKWGCVFDQIDFEWPTQEDLLRMPKDKPIKVESIQYKPCKQYNYLFGAIQVTLSNGVSSPVFTARQQDDSNFKAVNITNSS